jgi:N4-gp56 family major capsid protein
MADTNFAALTSEEKTVWARDTWTMARNMSFMGNFTGKGANSLIQRVTELRKDEKGARAVITLVADMTSDGITGDYEVEDNEEALTSHECVIECDQLRNGNRLAGRMADQKSVVEFRSNSRDQLAYWLSDRCDQMAFLTLSGVDYRLTNAGAFRAGFGHNGSAWTRNTTTSPVGRALYDLAFATDVTAPSTNRHFRWDASTGLEEGDITAVAAADVTTYEMLVRLKAKAKDKFIRGIKGKDGQEFYHVFLTPQGMADLRLDPDYQDIMKSAGARGDKNELFKGASSVTIDGLVIHEYRHVYNTTKATAGSGGGDTGKIGYKWGTNGAVEGQRIILAGAQALAFADIGTPSWDERNHFDYGNKKGIAFGKITGLLKPVFHSNVDDADEDFGVLVCDVALSNKTA